MSELLEISAALTQAAHENQVSVLATVVRTEGSTYRRIGARLVALPDGSHVGTVSAGCIEADVLLRAERVRDARAMELATYDTRSPEDLIWGYGTGCGGLTELLLEPLEPGQALIKADRLRTVAEARGPGVLATVVHAKGVAVSPGDQAILQHAAAELTGFDAVAAPLRAMVASTACEMVRARSSAAVHHVCGGQQLDVAYEVRSRRVRLCVCGAGPDAAPLVAMAKRLGWHVTVIRPPADIAPAVAEADCDAAVVMNHHYDRDLEFLAAWLGSPVPFIGMLGPAHRTRLMLVRLAGMGIALERAGQRIRAPVGLDLGAETPEEIALAIVAEIKASISGRGGGPLRDRQSAIHDREEPGAERMNGVLRRLASGLGAAGVQGRDRRGRARRG